jgi:hypothetical protein
VTKKELDELRNAFGDYVASEGCSCCQDEGEHKRALARIAKVLKIPKYKDGSGYDTFRFRSKR